MPTHPRPAEQLRLILGDQLNPNHSWFNHTNAGIVYLLMEVRQETDYALHHAQKILAIFAAMRDFARHLRSLGHRVRYVALDDPSNRQDLCANLSALAMHYQASSLQWQQPDKWRLDQQLSVWSAQQPLNCRMVNSEHFLTTRHTLLLLVCSNVFMTFAWYAHLKELNNKPWLVAALVSWGIALFEYLLQMPANRIGYTALSLGELKVLQEVITLSLFVPFVVLYMKEPLKLDYLWAGLCLVGAVFFMFRDRLG